MSFSNKNLTSVQTPHNDPIVVTIVVVNYEVRKVLIDSRSAIAILFYNTFEKMKLPINRLALSTKPLVWIHKKSNNV